MNDGIPPVSDYAHHNEEAQAVWHAENRYDMLYPPEPAEPDNSELYTEDWGDEDFYED